LIVHQPEQARFVAVIDDQQAQLEYNLLPRHGIDFSYTFVPQSLRGQGIAEKLVHTGLAWARQQEYEIEASCWYVRKFLRKF
jgi:hypothetical protein